MRDAVGVDFARPIEAVLLGVQGRVLAVLAETTAELNLRTIALLSGEPCSGLSCAVRVGRVGACREQRGTPSSLFRLVLEHVAAGPLVALARARDAVVEDMGRVAETLPLVPESVIVFGFFARGEADGEGDIDAGFVRPAAVDESFEAWADSVEQRESQIRRLSGNLVEVLDVGSDEVCARLWSQRSVWRDVRREGIVVHGRVLDELAEIPDG